MIKRTVRKCYNQNDYQEVLQPKGLPGLPRSATIKMTTRKVLQSNGLPGSATIKRTVRECYIQKDCQEVVQSKGLPIKKTVREQKSK